MNRRDLLAALAALAGALLLEPVGAASWGRDVALLAGLAVTAPLAALCARTGWATPVLAQVLGWCVIIATSSPIRLHGLGTDVITIQEGLSLSPWLALVSPLSIGAGLGLLAFSASFGAGQDRGGRSTSRRR